MKKKPTKNKSIVKSKEVFTNSLLSQAFFPGGVNNPFAQGTQVNQVNTLFKNERWYLISNFRQLLSQAYVEQGLLRTICQVPVDDAFRGGVDIKSQQLDEDEITELDAVMEQEGDLSIMAQAEVWKRLYGGAGVIILTEQDPSTPLDISQIGPGKKLEYRDVDMWELFWSYQNTDDYSKTMDSGDGDPLPDTEFFNYYGIKLHQSRVMIMRGTKAPSFIRPRLRGWGLSIAEDLVNAINSFLKSKNLIFEILDEYKIDVYKIDNLATTLLSPNGTLAVQERIQVANMQKNYQNALVLDGKDDYIQKQLTWSGIAETLGGIRIDIASAMRMPISKIFGIGAQGFSSGEDDIENYNSMVESSIRSKCKFHVIKMIQLRCQQLFGYIPDDLTIDFKPLRQLSSEQQENVKTQIYSRVLQARQAGEMSHLEFREACNKADLLPVQLETTDNAIEEAQEDSEGDEEDSATAEGKPAPKSKLKAKEAKS